MRVKFTPFNGSVDVLNMSLSAGNVSSLPELILNQTLGELSQGMDNLTIAPAGLQVGAPVHGDEHPLVTVIKLFTNALPVHDGHHTMMVSFAFWILFWWVLFYVMAEVYERWWIKDMPTSSKDHENCKYWLSRHWVSTFMSICVCVITVPGMFRLAAEPAYMRYAATPHVAYCDASEIGEPLETWGVLIAYAGLVCTSSVIADTFIMFMHGYSTPDYIAHHFVFCFAGVLIRWNCMLPYEAAILMSMEASTPFLNFLLVYRHRGLGYQTRMAVCGVMFFILFTITRLGMNTWGAIQLAVHFDEYLAPVVPLWQARSLLVMVMAGAVVQFFWAPAIIKAFGANLMPLLKGMAGGDASEIQEALEK